MAKSAWDGVLRALSTTPHDIRSLKGVTGYSHAFAGIGVDSSRRRLVVISTDTDPRIVAMAQADIQATDTSVHVIAVRPLVLDTTLPLEALAALVDGSPIIKRAESLASLLTSGSDQADALSVEALLGSLLRPVFESLESETKSPQTNPEPPRLATQEDPFGLDRQFGICPLPLYQLWDAEIDTILTGTDIDAIREVLVRLGVQQFFFPSPDQIALGLVESRVGGPQQIVQDLREVPEMGHPFGSKELVAEDTPLAEIIEALNAQKLIIEGEYSYELTPAGRSIRSVVRFKPREGVLTKLLNRISVSFSIKDLFGGPQ